MCCDCVVTHQCVAYCRWLTARCSVHTTAGSTTGAASAPRCRRQPSAAACESQRCPATRRTVGFLYHVWTICALPVACRAQMQVLCDGELNQYALHRSVCAGLVWVWPGIGEAPEVPTFSPPPRGYTIHSEIEVSVSCCIGLCCTCVPPMLAHLIMYLCRSDIVSATSASPGGGARGARPADGEPAGSGACAFHPHLHFRKGLANPRLGGSCSLNWLSSLHSASSVQPEMTSCSDTHHLWTTRSA
jgi:hypothetical protein